MIFFGQEFSEHAIEEAVLVAEKTYPKECCGLLFRKTDSDISTLFVPLTNHSLDADHFEVNELEHIALLLEQKAAGFVPSGLLHSHPDSEARLSMTDQRKLVIQGNYVLGSLLAFVLEVRDGKARKLAGYSFCNEEQKFSRESNWI